MEKVRIKSDIAKNVSVSICGEDVVFDKDGFAEVDQSVADYAVKIPGYSIESGKPNSSKKEEPVSPGPDESVKGFKKNKGNKSDKTPETKEPQIPGGSETGEEGGEGSGE